MKIKGPFPIRYTAVLILFYAALSTACAVNRQMGRQVGKRFQGSAVLNGHQVGFALSDLDDGKVIYEKDADKYFIPASNTKLFTFYAGLKLLQDSIPSLRYIEKGDSLIFWGTGDPSFLQNRIKGGNTLRFLQTTKKQLFFAAGRYTGNFYGLGWAWDDYNDDYQAEITEFPLMDNMIALSGQKGVLKVSPADFNDCFIKEILPGGKTFNVTRNFNENVFHYPEMPVPSGYQQFVPYKTSTLLTLNLLTDTLHKAVQLIDMEMPASAKTVFNVPSEQVLREMMLPSDNFIAEQLLLVYSNQFQTGLSGTDAIRYIKQKYLNELPGTPRWVDGSGLSRMNLFSPREIITLLKMIDIQLNNRQKLFSMLPAGGKTGTLLHAYPKTEHPFVYGKTGTFSNNYNQSGYLLTKKGRTLSFSFMNNNFVAPLSDVKAEMTKMITYIHENF